MTWSRKHWPWIAMGVGVSLHMIGIYAGVHLFSGC
jgi:hypothetical protein